MQAEACLDQWHPILTMYYQVWIVLVTCPKYTYAVLQHVYAVLEHAYTVLEDVYAFLEQGCTKISLLVPTVYFYAILEHGGVTNRDFIIQNNWLSE